MWTRKSARPAVLYVSAIAVLRVVVASRLFSKCEEAFCLGPEEEGCWSLFFLCACVRARACGVSRVRRCSFCLITIIVLASSTAGVAPTRYQADLFTSQPAFRSQWVNLTAYRHR